MASKLLPVYQDPPPTVIPNAISEPEVPAIKSLPAISVPLVRLKLFPLPASTGIEPVEGTNIGFTYVKPVDEGDSVLPIELVVIVTLCNDPELEPDNINAGGPAPEIDAVTKVKDEEALIASTKFSVNAWSEPLISTKTSLSLSSNKEADTTGTKSTPLIVNSWSDPEGISLIAIEDVANVAPSACEPVGHCVFAIS